MNQNPDKSRRVLFKNRYRKNHKDYVDPKTGKLYEFSKNNIDDKEQEDLVELKKKNQTGDVLTDVFDNVHPPLKFWDEVDTFPAIHLNAGSEKRE